MNRAGELRKGPVIRQQTQPAALPLAFPHYTKV